MTIAAAAHLRAGLLRCAESTQDLRRFMVGLWHEVRVHVERRRRVSVSQATCHGPYVDTGAQQTGGVARGVARRPTVARAGLTDGRSWFRSGRA